MLFCVLVSSPAIISATAMRWNQVNILPVMRMGNNRRLPIRNTHIWNIYETYSKHICQYMSYMCHICRHIYEHICTLGNICALICTYTSVHVCNIYAPLHICVHIFTLICAYMWAQYKYHIWHLTYMVHICQYYMQHICQMPYMLLILSIYKCACM